MVTRGLHTPMGSLRVHLHNHQIGISLSMLQPNKTLYQSYKCNRANDEWFLSSSASCCCCVLSPFFYRQSNARDDIHESQGFARPWLYSLTQWIVSSHEFAHSLRKCTFLDWQYCGTALLIEFYMILLTCFLSREAPSSCESIRKVGASARCIATRSYFFTTFSVVLDRNENKKLLQVLRPCARALDHINQLAQRAACRLGNRIMYAMTITMRPSTACCEKKYKYLHRMFDILFSEITKLKN